MVVIDKRNGDLEKNTKLEKETESQDKCRLHKVDKEALSSSKTSGTPPSPPLPSPPSDPEENLEYDPFQTPQRNTISQEQYKMVTKGTLWDGILTRRQKGKN